MSKCVKCGRETPDTRTLRMSCLYAMEELKVPFEKMEREYCLTVCKSCRADWMAAIEKWFNTPTVEESCGSGIYVRRNGVSIEVTAEE